MTNLDILGSLRYVVWTQAGFRKAIKHLHKTVGDTELEDQEPIEGYPKSYPCVVEFHRQYAGYHYWHAKCVPLSAAIDRARKALERLQKINAEHYPKATP